MRWFIKALKKYACFSGRASRPEYCYFLLFLFLIQIGLGILLGIAVAPQPADAWGLGFLCFLPFLIPYCAVIMRRLHDAGNSGCWLLAAFLGPLSLFFLLGLMFLESDGGDNAYGPNPNNV